MKLKGTYFCSYHVVAESIEQGQVKISELDESHSCQPDKLEEEFENTESGRKGRIEKAKKQVEDLNNVVEGIVKDEFGGGGGWGVRETRKRRISYREWDGSDEGLEPVKQESDDDGFEHGGGNYDYSTSGRDGKTGEGDKKGGGAAYYPGAAELSSEISILLSVSLPFISLQSPTAHTSPSYCIDW
jgi:hypothetical protein